MSESGQHEAGLYDYVTTSLDFFGIPGSDLSFGYPGRYYEQIDEAQRRLEEHGLPEIERARVAAITANSPDDRQQLDREFDQSIARARSDATWQVNHSWYESRFRNNHVSGDVDLRHPRAADYFDGFNDYRPGPPSPRPDSSYVIAYLNDAITESQWSGAYTNAKRWHSDMGEDDADRQVAAQYVGFTGNLILQEYCRIAVALTDGSLADDSFVSTKHLVTVCWPTANQLEPFIPQQVRQAKQLLREVFLQAAVNGFRLRSDLERFGYHLIGEEEAEGIEERIQQEERSLRQLMRFDEDQEVDQQKIASRVNATVDALVADNHWNRAINFLDLARYAFDIFTDDVQERIDQLALAAADYYTRDMGDYTTRYQVPGAYERWESFSDLYSSLTFAPGITDAVRRQMEIMKDSRHIEHNIQQRSENIGDKKITREATYDLFRAFLNSDESVVRQLGSAELAQDMIDMLGTLDSQTSPRTYDYIVTGIIRLTNHEFFTIEQQNELLVALAGNLCDQGMQQQTGETFHSQFMGLISPIMRATETAATTEDEAVWKFVSRAQFEAAINSTISAIDRQREEEYAAWLEQLRDRLLADVRAGWSWYWDEVQEYQ